MSAEVLIRPLGRPGDLGWVVLAHGETYAAEFGWDTSFEALVARIVADHAAEHDPAREAAWVAEGDGERAGCVFCVSEDGSTAKLRILLVDPRARGLGVGGALVRACTDFAAGAGYRRITLRTTDVVVPAGRISAGRGLELVDREPHHSFGQDLVGENWAKD